MRDNATEKNEQNKQRPPPLLVCKCEAPWRREDDGGARRQMNTGELEAERAQYNRREGDAPVRGPYGRWTGGTRSTKADAEDITTTTSNKIFHGVPSA